MIVKECIDQLKFGNHYFQFSDSSWTQNVVKPYKRTALNEIIFENRLLVKLNSLNKFIKLLSDYMSTHNVTDFKINDIDKEILKDVLETVVRKFVETGSRQKAQAFANKFIYHIKANKSSVDLTQINH